MSAPDMPDVAGLPAALATIGDAVAARHGVREAVRLFVEAAIGVAERSGEIEPEALAFVFLEVAKGLLPDDDGDDDGGRA